MMHGRRFEGTHDVLCQRLAGSRNARLAAIIGDLSTALGGIIAKHHVSPADLKDAVRFATEVGLASDEKRSEWVLLADALGLTAAIEKSSVDRPQAATPQTILGPFFRQGAPRKTSGDNLSRDGVGAPLAVALDVVDLDLSPVAGATVDVWHANGKGKFENQDPDSQPDFNLRGCFVTDAKGKVSFDTVRPAGYSLPDDGPVARLLFGLGLSIRRPAHIQFRIVADGFQTLVTHLFDRDDPCIDADPLFCVAPALLADFGGSGTAKDHVTRFTFKLARSRPDTPVN